MVKSENLGFTFMGVGMLALIIMLWTIPVQKPVREVAPKVVHVKVVPTAISKVSASAVAKELLTPMSYKCWAKIVKAESHFNPLAHSPISDASGIGQLLRSTYASLGMNPIRNDVSQLVAMLSYVNRRFGGTNALCSAYKYHLQFGSY